MRYNKKSFKQVDYSDKKNCQRDNIKQPQNTSKKNKNVSNNNQQLAHSTKKDDPLRQRYQENSELSDQSFIDKSNKKNAGKKQKGNWIKQAYKKRRESQQKAKE